MLALATLPLARGMVWPADPALPARWVSGQPGTAGEEVRMASTVEDRQQRGLTRQSALKVGAAGLLGAAFGGFFPGRAGAGGIKPVACRPGQGYICGGTDLNACDAPGKGCSCATQFTNGKIQNTKSYCVDFNVCCGDLATCPGGQSQCRPGYTCSASTCCGEPVCLPPCGTSVGSGTCCLTPVGNSNDCEVCTSGGNCNVGFNQCSTCGGPNDLGYYCFTTTENTAICGQNSYCDQVPGCSSSADCGPGFACITSNGCTGCSSVGGVCIPLCSAAGASPQSKTKGHGMTAAGIRY